MEHVGAFRRYSRFRVYELNTALGMPRKLPRFDAILFHYTIFSTAGYHLDADLLHYLESTARDSYKIALFQDECHYCRQRFAFLNRHDIDCVYTIVAPQYVASVYGKYTRVPKVISHIPGYVGDDLLSAAGRFSKPDAERTIDIGYRGRRLPLHLGRTGQEKYEIGIRFKEAAALSGLRLDIACEEEDRIYGEDWYRFVADCRAVLGSESGIGLIDIEDEVLEEYNRLAASGEPITLERLDCGALGRVEGLIPYRSIAPRHFEAAALRVCQILYEGDYSGMMEPMVHYIPLKKDFSNLDEALERFRDTELRATLTENAHRDLIASGRYSYAAFVEGFDQMLLDAGLTPALPARAARTIGRRVRRGERRRRLRLFVAYRVMPPLRTADYPGKHAARALYHAAAAAQRAIRSGIASG